MTIRLRRRILKQLKRTNNLDDHIQYQKRRAEARRTLREAKKKSWENYVQSINLRISSAEVWNKIKALDRAASITIISFICAKNTLLTDSQQIAEEFARYFALQSSTLNFSQTFLSRKAKAENQKLCFTSDNLEPYNCNITKEELHNAIKNTASAAVGPDQIHLNMLRNASPNIL